MNKTDYIMLVNAIIQAKDCDRWTHCKLGIAVLEFLEQETGDSNEKKYGSFLRWWLFDRPDAGRNAKEAWANGSNKEKVFLPDADSLYDFVMEV